MEYRITASDLARRLGDILGQVRYRGDVFLVERHNRPIARITPVANAESPSVRDALAAWTGAGEPDSDFAEVLDLVGKMDAPARDPWDS